MFGETQLRHTVAEERCNEIRRVEVVWHLVSQSTLLPSDPLINVTRVDKASLYPYSKYTVHLTNYFRKL